MAIVTWKGWRKEPNESCKEAYAFLTGGRMKPFVVVFGDPETTKNLPKDEMDDQAELDETIE